MVIEISLISGENNSIDIRLDSKLSDMDYPDDCLSDSVAMLEVSFIPSSVKCYGSRST